MSGFLITFEGPEGSGKTTQARLLKEYLEKNGYQVLYTREPGGTSLGKKIRALLLSPENKEMKERTELFLYAADRSQHVEEIIRPALLEGKIVLCDRFIDSTVAYQGYGRGLDMKTIIELNEKATGGIKPHLTILLDINHQNGLERALSLCKDGLEEGTGDRIEQEEDTFHQQVRTGFLSLAETESQRIKIVDASLRIQEVALIVRGLVNNLLAKEGRL